MNLYRVEIRDANERFEDALVRANNKLHAAEIARDVIEERGGVVAFDWHFAVYKFIEPEGAGHVYEPLQDPYLTSRKGRSRAKN